MLPLLKRVTARALRSTLSDRAEFLTGEEEPILSVNVEELCELLPPLPDFAWSRVVDICSKTVSPVCNAVQKTFGEDMDHVAQLLIDLNPPSLNDYEGSDGSTFFVAPFPETCDLTQPGSAFPMRSRRGSQGSAVSDCDSPVVIPNPDPSLPTIIITPCPSQPREDSCLVPYQDAAFGNRLVIPTHPTINDVFPPLIGRQPPLVEHWHFSNGHWWALLPSTEEQMRRGMFSRPVFSRRRRSCVDSRSKYPRTRHSTSSRDI